jgi:hypothetical protein
MWLFDVDGFLSITEHREKPDYLHVRGRVSGDIEHYFPNAVVTRTEDADYLYRATLPRTEVADRVRKIIMDIQPGSFKDSVTDKRRKAYYFSVWDTCYLMQEELSR